MYITWNFMKWIHEDSFCSMSCNSVGYVFSSFSIPVGRLESVSGWWRWVTCTMLTWKAVSGWWKVSLHRLYVCVLSCFSRVWLFATLWSIAHQALLSMKFSRQEYWSGLPFPSPGDLPDPGIEPRFPSLEADSLTSEPPGKPIYKPIYIYIGFPGGSAVENLPANTR